MDTDILAIIRRCCPTGAVFLTQCSEHGCSAHSHISRMIIKGESIAAPDEKAVDCVFLPDGTAAGVCS